MTRVVATRGGEALVPSLEPGPVLVRRCDDAACAAGSDGVAARVLRATTSEVDLTWR